MRTPARAGAFLAALAIASGLCLDEARPAIVSGPTSESASQDPEIIEARRLVAKKSWDEAEAHLRGYLAARGKSADAEGHELLAETLLAQDRDDEAAEQLERAMVRVANTEGESGRYRDLRKRVWELDPVGRARTSLINKCVNEMLESAEELVQHEHWERALDVLSGLELLAIGKERERALELHANVKKRFTVVDLDAAGTGSDSTRPLVTVISDHYRLEGNLEESVVKLVADTMDDIHESYVQIYLAGDESRAREKATIRVHADWEKMTDEWPGGDRPSGLGGWWEPANKRVVCYDTRTDSGTLDVMLGTLFHEASHQFMTALVENGGGWAPAWLNEGTASFFEGAKAMADRRVLWPDAATGRLRNLQLVMTGLIMIADEPEEGEEGEPARRVLSLDDVIGFSQPGSYPGIMYPYGWGLVYYLQQYEDPKTLAFVWRPYYQRYKDRITTTKPYLDSIELFKEVFLAPGNPGGFSTLKDFELGFGDWIKNEIHPLHVGDQRRELRLARVKQYRDAAEKGGGAVGREELLERALRDLEFVRTSIDDPDAPNGNLLLTQIEVLAQLGRTGAEAAMIELVLDLADAGQFALGKDERASQDRYAALEERMFTIDKANEHPRRAKTRIKKLRQRAHGVLAQYQELDPPLPVRARSFAELLGRALGDDHVLLPAAAQLAGGGVDLVGAGTLVSGTSWTGFFPAGESKLERDAGSVTLRAERDAAGRICTDVPVGGEYEVRGRLVRGGAGAMGSYHGIVVSGTRDGAWLVLAIDGAGRMSLERWWSEDGAIEDDRIDRVVLDLPIAADENPIFRVRAFPDGALDVQIGEREQVVRFELDEPLPESAHVGVFVKRGTTTLESLAVEMF